MMINDTLSKEEQLENMIDNMNGTVKSINKRFSVKEFAGVLELCVDGIQQMGFAEMNPNKFVKAIDDNFAGLIEDTGIENVFYVIGKTFLENF